MVIDAVSYTHLDVYKRQVYQEADWNVSVTTQPHSEVSSLAIFLHMFYEEKELDLEFEGGDMKVIPSQKGKNVQVKK